MQSVGLHTKDSEYDFPSMSSRVTSPDTPSKFLLNCTSQSGVGCTSFIRRSQDACCGVRPCRRSNRNCGSAARAAPARMTKARRMRMEGSADQSYADEALSSTATRRGGGGHAADAPRHETFTTGLGPAPVPPVRTWGEW